MIAQDTSAAAQPFHYRRPIYKIALHWLRRGHLYAGLMMLPWVILYGVTSFLFNHPTWFSDQPAVSFDRNDLAGTTMQSLPTPSETAEQAVAELQKRALSGSKYSLIEREQAKYTREFAFATVKAEGQEISLLFEVSGSGGSIRSRETQTPKAEERAPFAVGRSQSNRGGRATAKAKETGSQPENALVLPEPLHKRVQSAVPILLERKGFPTGEVTVTSVPDLAFLMDVDGTTWRVTYNAQTGTVSGRKPEDEQPSEISTRRFLLRLHIAHGYPGETGVRTAWAVVVDIMAGIMLFWGLSGLFMWWQIKATRRLGALLLLISIGLATWVGFAMHAMMTSG